MLKKVITIKNVGRFENYRAAGDVTLKRYNLVFAENGLGKTTLCAILRSAQGGEAAQVLGRKTLGSQGGPEIDLLLEAGNASFTAGTWTATLPQVAIFDAAFVSENVFSGDVVDIDHRRSLYRVIVGREGVALAQQIEELDAATRAKSTEIREKAAAVQALAPQGMTAETFAGLPQDPGIDERIASAERDLAALRQANQIRTRAGLSNLALPALPNGFEALLSKTIEGIAADAGQRVADQIATHGMHARGEAWISEGVGFIREDRCPFCSQGVGDVSALVDAYKAYFSGAYNDLRRQISTLRQQVDSSLGDRQIAAIERTLDQNNAAIEFWSAYAELTPPPLTADAAPGESLRVLRESALTLLDRKAAAPLEAVTLDAAYTAALGAIMSSEVVAAYNRTVTAANAAITARKAATGAADLTTAEATLSRLKATKARHELESVEACEAWYIARAEKAAIEERKEAIRAELDGYTRTVMGRYENTINTLLDDFNSGFRITETGHGYPGGVASSTYQILINNTRVELGDAGTPLDRPSFRNTLSAGDKSVLALAFFLAQLEHDPDRARKIVVFDDPFNSQDGFRKDCTIQKIRKCGETCAQVIVFSHDPFFLKRIWDRLRDPAERKCLALERLGLRATTLVPWDIERATQDGYNADRQTLLNYYHERRGGPRDVVQKIRPVLETYCRNLGGGILLEGDTLGTIVTKIRAAGTNHQLYPITDVLDELNDYTKRYHHGENPHAAIEPISDQELQGYVKRTLQHTGMMT